MGRSAAPHQMRNGNRPCFLAPFPFRILFLILILLALAKERSSFAQVRLNEFVADNKTGLQDEDGDESDWIELLNVTDQPVNLSGWTLTDNRSNPAKWSFPTTNLPPFSYLVIFASDKDRARSGQPLHTNFKLSANGEYLGLFRPDATVADEFAPAFPQQRPDAAYGLGTDSTADIVINAQAAVRFQAVLDDQFGQDWIQPDFDDAVWARGRLPLWAGSGSELTSVTGDTVLRLDFNDDDSGESGVADTEDGFTGFTLSDNGTSVAGISVTFEPIGAASLDDRDWDTPVENLPTLSRDQVYDDFIFAYQGVNEGDGLRIQLKGLDPGGTYQLTLWSFSGRNQGARTSDWLATTGDDTQIIHSNYSFDGSVLPETDGDNTMHALVTASAAGELSIEGRRRGSGSHGVFLNALELTRAGPGAVGTDVGEALGGRSSSVYLRIPFDVADPDSIQELLLQSRYADGFIVYVNATKLAARNAPENPAWDSTALNPRSPTEIAHEDRLLLEVPAGLLQAGRNVLAVHAFTSAMDDPVFLFEATLEQGGGGSATYRYFASPTPGSGNGQGLRGWVKDTKFSVDRGFYDQPFDLEITSATSDAVIVYTVDGSEPSLDNGIVYANPIRIDGTTVLRAAAFKQDHLPTNVDTHSYLFLDDVLRQTGAGFPTVWQPGYPADYEMDPAVVNDPRYSPTIKEDLRAIPTLSIVLPMDDLFGPERGIYNHSEQRGVRWERKASVEWIHPNGSTGFQVDAGLRIQGNASRYPDRLLKHSFRLLFKKVHGPGKLNHPLFSGSPVQRFDHIVLRACFTDSFATRYEYPRYKPEDSQYLRDVWMKDSQLAMGRLSGRGTFVHLYLDGLYWGLYNPTERLDASFFAEHMGGTREEWDVIRDFSEVLNGTKQAWNTVIAMANAGLQSDRAYRELEEWVDIDSLIDYMILHIYGEAEDWPHHNWYAARRRPNPETGYPGGRFTFHSWDQEIVLDVDVSRNRIDVNHDDTPARLYAKLRDNAEFRLRFADRVHLHLFNGGALTEKQSVARWMKRAMEIDRAIVGESARWGDYRRTPAFTREDWLKEQNRLLTRHFPQIGQKTIDRFRSAGLYPAVPAPAVSQHGGPVPKGYPLAMRTGRGTTYYTVDGTDPRVYGSGAVSANALPYTDPVELWTDTVIKARTLSGGVWSALVAMSFDVDQSGTLDTDGDGIPDQWEMLHQLNRLFGGDAQLDSDRDGISNYEEFVAGTDPSDSASRLGLAIVLDSEKGPSVAFRAHAERAYSLLHTENLDNTTWNIVRLIPAGDTARDISIPAAELPLSGAGFYRLSVRLR